MSRLFIIGFLSLALALPALAQQSRQATQMILRSNDGSTAYTIKRGDYVKVRMKPASMRAVYRGGFSRYENGVLYLRGKTGIPADQIESISYRPLARRILFWGLLLLSAILIDVGFLSVFAVEGPGPQNTAKAGFILLGCSLLFHIVSMSHARNIPDKWSVEQWSPPPSTQQPVPTP